MDDPNTLPESSPFADVPVEITVSVGKARPKIGDLLGLGRDAILTLDRKVDDPVDLFIGDRLIARGILQESEDGAIGQLSVRLTEVAGLPASLS